MLFHRKVGIMNELICNIEKLHTTELGAKRIRRNLSIDTDNPAEWCKDRILNHAVSIERRGKNWYVHTPDCEITVNAYSYTIITAHKNTKERNV